MVICVCHVPFITVYIYVLFVCILPQVYPDKTSDIAVRRLLLENVFLLAGRRIPVDTNLKSNDEKVQLTFLYAYILF